MFWSSIVACTFPECAKRIFLIFFPQRRSCSGILFAYDRRRLSYRGMEELLLKIWIKCFFLCDMLDMIMTVTWLNPANGQRNRLLHVTGWSSSCHSSFVQQVAVVLWGFLWSFLVLWADFSLFMLWHKYHAESGAGVCKAAHLGLCRVFLTSLKQQSCTFGSGLLGSVTCEIFEVALEVFLFFKFPKITLHFWKFSFLNLDEYPSIVEVYKL